MDGSGRSLLRRLLTRTVRLLLYASLGLTCAALITVVVLRWADPSQTSFMLQARLIAWWEGKPHAVHHEWVAYERIGSTVKLAAIATEDQKFPTHHGFDLQQIGYAIRDLRDGGRVRGASTITQQTAKNLFLWPSQSWLRKALEAGLTVVLELAWPKRRILETYLNVAQFGPDLYGVQAAAHEFFDKPASELTATESALLAAVLPSPARLSVVRPSAYLRNRQEEILRQMRVVRGLDGVRGLIEDSYVPRDSTRASISGR